MTTSIFIFLDIKKLIDCYLKFDGKNSQKT